MPAAHDLSRIRRHLSGQAAEHGFASHPQGRAARPPLPPEAADPLFLNFRATVAYVLLQEQHPTWHRSYLRTTSRLERFNRHLRRRIRSANAYHSDTGVLAMIAQVVDQAVPLPAQYKQWTIFSNLKRYTNKVTNQAFLLGAISRLHARLAPRKTSSVSSSPLPVRVSAPGQIAASGWALPR